MDEKVTISGVDYDLSLLNKRARDCLDSIVFIDNKISEMHNFSALLNKAKQGYIGVVKAEILTRKTGFQLGED